MRSVCVAGGRVLAMQIVLASVSIPRAEVVALNF